MMYKGFSLLDLLHPRLGKLDFANVSVKDIDEMAKNFFSGLDDLLIRHAIISAMAPKFLELELARAKEKLRFDDLSAVELEEEALRMAKDALAAAFTHFELEY